MEISEPKVAPGTGMAMYTISYRAVVWQPFRGEVVDGEVSQVVANGFFVDVGALGVFVSKAVSYTLVSWEGLLGVGEGLGVGNAWAGRTGEWSMEALTVSHR